jgi:hypothetical protein
MLKLTPRFPNKTSLLHRGISTPDSLTEFLPKRFEVTKKVELVAIVIGNTIRSQLLQEVDKDSSSLVFGAMLGRSSPAVEDIGAILVSVVDEEAIECLRMLSALLPRHVRSSPYNSNIIDVSGRCGWIAA